MKQSKVVKSQYYKNTTKLQEEIYMGNQKNILRHSVLSTELTLMAPTGLLQNIIKNLHLYIGHGDASELVTS